jgi:hypothetical protein
MPEYQTKLIANFTTGYLSAREPWLALDDAFPTLLDARVDKGVLSKRLGYTQLATTGAGKPIMGIHASMQLGHPVYLVLDTKRAYKYDPYAASLSDLSGSDVFNGFDTDFFWFQDWRDACYFCNGVDSVYKYDRLAGTCAALTLTYSGTTIQSCRMIFRYKSRLHFIGCTVDGTYYPRRSYYTTVNTETIAGYVNMDIEDNFTGGCYMNGLPTLFGHESYIARLKYTGHTDTPFAWTEVASDGGSLGPLRAPTFGRKAIQVGHARLWTWDNYGVKPVAEQIRDVVDSLDNFRAWYLCSALRRDRNVLYLAYPNNGSTSNDRLLEYNWDDNTFAVHRISAHCLHGGTGHVISKAEDIDAVFGADGTVPDWHDLLPVRHPTYGAFMLLGGHAGKLHILNYGTTDAETTISASVWTKAFNPFKASGRKVKLGNVRVFLTTHASKSCTVGFYKDLGTSAYKSSTLSAAGSGDKHWETLHADGEVGEFHRLQFSGDLPDIHAIELDMAEAEGL